jgi:thiopeptide-type bacteriocin biosynthesis protein
VLAAVVHPDMPLFAADGQAAYTAPWLAAHVQAGQKLGTAANGGHLDRGLRAVLAQIVIFHWNRLGLPAHTQGILAHAAKAAILTRD